MADLTITSSNEADGRVRYDLGRANWGAPVPDLRHPGSTTTIGSSDWVDVVILGDGYVDETVFRARLDDWIRSFFDIRPYDVFAGAFRIRALYTPSTEHASTSRGSYYRVGTTEGDTGVSKESWEVADDEDGRHFRQRMWDAVDSFYGVNEQQYPSTLDVGDDHAVSNDGIRDCYRNLVICMLVQTSGSVNVSGMTSNVQRDDAPTRHARVAFGANAIHEFTHAFGYLSDEYIDGRERVNTRTNPPVPSVFTLSNLTFSDLEGDVPWAHLAPTGAFPRTAGEPAPSPVAGWLWIGGVVKTGAWHSEYRCLMNGTHDNFAFTQDVARDPTANADGSYTDEHGARLRDSDRLCLWCQEIATIRILERTRWFAEPGDPADPTALGEAWYAKWRSTLRATYFDVFGVPEQIAANEAAYAAMFPGRGGEPLWQSDLYSVPRASASSSSGPIAALDDAEMLLLLG